MKHLKHALKWISELSDLGFAYHPDAYRPDRKAKLRSDALDMMAEKRPHVTIQTYSREAINERKLKDAKHRQLAKELGRAWKS